STCSTTSSCPTMTLRSSVRMRLRPSATRSALRAGAESSVGERIDNLVDAHAICHGRVLDVAGIVLGIRPFPAIAHVGVPIDEQHRPIGIVEDGAQVRDVAALLPAASCHERAQAGHLRVAIDLVEAAEHRVVFRNLDDLTVGEDLLDFTDEVFPLERTVE